MALTIFSTANILAAGGWLLLIATLFAPSLRPVGWAVAGRWLPAGFALLYAALIASAWGTDGGFGSIDDVRTLFADDRALTAGWLHYLAFDLFVGRWIARDGLARGVPRALLVPCLMLTFLLGPVGLLAALATRAAWRAETAA